MYGTGILWLLAYCTAAAIPAECPQAQVGEARLQVFVFPIYTSALFSSDGRYDESSRPVCLKISYLRNIPGQSFVDRTAEEWEHIGFAHPESAAWLAQLARILPDVRKGDSITFLFDGDGGSRFFLNDQLIGAMDDPEFGAGFLAIWLSPATSQPEMRLGLIGQR